MFFILVSFNLWPTTVPLQYCPYEMGRRFNKKVSNAVYVLGPHFWSHQIQTHQMLLLSPRLQSHTWIYSILPSRNWKSRCQLILGKCHQKQQLSEVLLRGMNHSLHLLTGHRLQDFIVKKPLMARGTLSIKNVSIDPFADRPLLSMVPKSNWKFFLFKNEPAMFAKIPTVHIFCYTKAE